MYNNPYPTGYDKYATIYYDFAPICVRSTLSFEAELCGNELIRSSAVQTDCTMDCDVQRITTYYISRSRLTTSFKSSSRIQTTDTTLVFKFFIPWSKITYSLDFEVTTCQQQKRKSLLPSCVASTLESRRRRPWLNSLHRRALVLTLCNVGTRLYLPTSNGRLYTYKVGVVTKLYMVFFPL